MRIDGPGQAPDTPLGDIFGLYTPPFRLVSEMLVTGFLCPTGPLRATFGGLPFLSLGGKTPVVVWFATVQQIEYRSDGRPALVGSPAAPLYQEMTFVALLRQRACFVPAIYANDLLTLQVGWRYGMPKERRALRLETDEKSVTATVTGERTDVSVRFSRGKRFEAAERLLGRLLPFRTWPMRFPGGRSLCPALTEARYIERGRVQGSLWLKTRWLPGRVRFLPWGLYVPRQVMVMPFIAE